MYASFFTSEFTAEEAAGGWEDVALERIEEAADCGEYCFSSLSSICRLSLLRELRMSCM